MTSIEFFSLYLDNVTAFYIIAIIVVLLYVLIANKLADSWLNPIKINVLQAGIGMSVACFIYILGEATRQTFWYVVFSSIIFWSILVFLFPKRIGELRMGIKNESIFSKNLFLFLYIGNILLQLITYSLFGIPLFNDDSRLATYTGSGGYGVILRLTGYFQVYSMFYIFHRSIKPEGVNWKKLTILLSPLVLFGLLSGSRSSFISFIFGFWGFNKFYKGKEVYLLRYKFLFVPFVLIAVLAFSLQNSSNLLGGVISFLERTLACGDLYWEAMPYDTWKDVVIKTPFSDLLVGFLGPLRIMPESATDVPIGYQLTQIVYQGYDKMTGPVELFPISSLIYFGYHGGIVMVVVQALLACAFFKLFFRKANSLILSSLLYFSFIKSIDFLGPLRSASGQLFDIMLNVLFVLFMCLVIALFRTIAKRSTLTE